MVNDFLNKIVLMTHTFDASGPVRNVVLACVVLIIRFLYYEKLTFKKKISQMYFHLMA